MDLGSGTGILALAACRAGAARVYAIDHASILNVASMLARQNHFSDRIVFINADARSVDIPEPADVIVSECLGLMGIGGTMVPAVMDMGSRSLRPGGRVIPGQHVAVSGAGGVGVECRLRQRVDAKRAGRFRFLAAAGTGSTTTSTSRLCGAEDLIADAQTDVPARSAPAGLGWDRPCSRRVSRRARVGYTAYCGWFEADLSGGVLG